MHTLGNYSLVVAFLFAFQILQQSQHSQLKTTAIFALPTLVESVLTHWKILPAVVSLKLVALASALSGDFNRYMQLAVNSVLSPVCHGYSA